MQKSRQNGIGYLACRFRGDLYLKQTLLLVCRELLEGAEQPLIFFIPHEQAIFLYIHTLDQLSCFVIDDKFAGTE